MNKIDRGGADGQRVLRDIRARLTPRHRADGFGARPGHAATRASSPYGAADAGFTAGLAEVLAEHDDALLAA